MKTIVLMADGGSRGNPGPAAYGYVLYEVSGEYFEQNPESIGGYVAGIEPVFEAGEYCGETTNNVAEWSGLVEGIKKAIELFGTDIELVVLLDSELVVKQMTGVYKVKHPGLKPLHAEGVGAFVRIKKRKIAHVYRTMNKRADSLVNHALDMRG